MMCLFLKFQQFLLFFLSIYQFHCEKPNSTCVTDCCRSCSWKETIFLLQKLIPCQKQILSLSIFCTWWELFFNHPPPPPKKMIHLPAIQNQHGAHFTCKTEEDKPNGFLFYLFLILCASLQSDFLELNKM